MATFRKRGKSWYAEVTRHGKRKSATFKTKAEAVAWAAQAEADIISGKRGSIPDKTFADLLGKYAADVSPSKKGARWGEIRLAKLAGMDIGKIRLDALTATDVAEWRDARLKEVSPSSVVREWKLLSSACNVALTEWKWLAENPFVGVKRPAENKPRDRLIADNEIERILFACGYDYAKTPETAYARVGAAFLFAIETAMRAGEIIGMTWNDVNVDVRVAKLRDTKNGFDRDVPLSREAIRILEQLPKSDPVFGITSASLDALFRKAKQSAVIEGVTFHDSRHLAITRLAKKLDVLDLARMVGHRNLSQLMIYYNAPASETAKLLD